MKPKHLYFFLLVPLLVFQMCKPQEEFSDIPEITNVELQEGDTMMLVVKFRDGDGDVGLADSDTMPPYQPLKVAGGDTIPNRYHYNFWVNYYEKIEGVWELIETPGGLDFRIPVITPQGQNKQIEATAELILEVPSRLNPQSDTLKYEVKVIDRALHESSWVSSQPYVLR